MPDVTMDAITINVLLIVFFAIFIRSAFGFGEALVAVPLLAFSIPVEIAAPLVTLLSVTVAAIVILQDWRKIHLRSMGWLLAPTLVGIPLGIALLRCAHQQFVKSALAIVIVAFSAYCLLGKRLPELRTDSRVWLLGCGFVAGLLGGLWNERAALSYLWGDAALVSAAFPSDAAGLFPASEYGRNGGILVSGTVGASRNSLLRDFSVCRASIYFFWQSRQSSHTRRRLSQICSRWPIVRWSTLVGPSNPSRIDADRSKQHCSVACSVCVGNYGFPRIVNSRERAAMVAVFCA